MNPPPQVATEGLQVESQAGKPGNAIWGTGVRGHEYTVETTVDAETWVIGEALLTRYAAAKGQGALPIMHGLVQLGQVKVLDVHGRLERCAIGVGGLCNGQVLVHASWKLIAV